MMSCPLPLPALQPALHPQPTLAADFPIHIGIKRGSDELLSQSGVAVMAPAAPHHPDNNNQDSATKKVKLEPNVGKPSKVIHIRNIPNETNEAEIIQLGIPFGRVTNVLVLKGKNQAFLEMAEETSAVAMVGYFSTCTAQLRGRAVYVQFSNHRELKTDQTHSNASASAQAALQAAQTLAGGAAAGTVTNGGTVPADIQGGPNTVLRVIVEHMLYPIVLDVLHTIFQRYGKVLKIVTFTKNNSFQALIQYPDTISAQTAKAALDGQNIYNGCCTLRIDYSKMSSLNVKYNNDKSRDYTNPTLPSGDGEHLSLGAADLLPSLLLAGRPGLTRDRLSTIRPDIVLVDHSKNTTYIVDVTIPHDENLQKTERDKILKYMDLAHEIKDMWRTPATIVVPIVISTNGLIPKGLHFNLCKVGVDGGLKYLMQKAVLLSTCRTLRAPGVLAPPFSLGLGAGGYAGLASGLPGFGALALQGALSGAAPALRALPQTLPLATVLLVSNLNEEMVTPDALFTLFGVYGDVQRVKILYNKKDSALIQLAEPHQAHLAMTHMDKIRVFGKAMRVMLSKHQTVQLPKEGQPDAGLTRDYSQSPLHRFKKPGSKNYQNIYPPSATLHLSNIPTTVSEEEIREAFSEKDFTVKAFKFFPKDRKMALVQLPSIDDAVAALIKLHNHQLSESNHLRVSFSKSSI